MNTSQDSPDTAMNMNMNLAGFIHIFIHQLVNKYLGTKDYPGYLLCVPGEWRYYVTVLLQTPSNDH